MPLLSPLRCAATGVPLSLTPGDPHVPSIDRKDSTLGYTPENCWIVSWEFNDAKHTKTLHSTYT